MVSGNVGLNCHLSEVISYLIDPVTYEEGGNEIDSTDELLARIDKINEKISHGHVETNELDDVIELKDLKTSFVCPLSFWTASCVLAR